MRTTLDTKLQVLARKVLTQGLVQFDEGQGWRGPSARSTFPAIGASNSPKPRRCPTWRVRLAVVLEVNDQSARIGLQPGARAGGFVSKERNIGILPLDGVKWQKAAARP